MRINTTCNIFYFSGTGNTWWVSERIAEELKTLGISAKAHSIEQVSESQTEGLINQSTMIGLGFPIYGSDAPRIFHDFMRILPQQTTPKKTLGFVTQWMWSGDGINFLEKDLQKKGYDLRWSAEFNMPNNIALHPLIYSADYEVTHPKLEKCEENIRAFCSKVAKGEKYQQHSDWFSAASAWIQRGPFRLLHDFGHRFWSVDAEACTSCNKCKRICPVENIEMLDGLPVHGDACVYCIRCFNFCPT